MRTYQEHNPNWRLLCPLFTASKKLRSIRLRQFWMPSVAMRWRLCDRSLPMLNSCVSSLKRQACISAMVLLVAGRHRFNEKDNGNDRSCPRTVAGARCKQSDACQAVVTDRTQTLSTPTTTNTTDMTAKIKLRYLVTGFCCCWALVGWPPAR